ncbi:MAG: 30S ribosomal protein S12 methylthiotransferase RimO, partial [Puniceicoccales bacterium]|nr:30S ribosomal protein S12 methylthiotransferase RimO [Puniceicoccales bacterium]
MLKVGLISLGCAKNLVDSEVMAGHLQRAGMVLTADAADADALIINTCSFIDAAKRESIAAIHNAAAERAAAGDANDAAAGSNRRRRHRQKIIVAGCLSQRFRAELPALMPEVDAFIGLGEVAKVAEVIAGLFGEQGAGSGEQGGSAGEEGQRDEGKGIRDKGKGQRATAGGAPHALPAPRSPLPAPLPSTSASLPFIPDYTTPRFRLTPAHYAYVKIAEGCDHGCAFCVIPQIRGRHRSRPQADVVAEVRQLVAAGVREINLISQDTTFFGMDKWRGAKPGKRAGVDSARGESIASLIRELDAIEGDFWLRLLYTHPAHWSDELIETFAGARHLARYVDIPLQHISDPMLAAMRRETDGAHIRGLLRRLRAGIPGLAIRTTFIVGFPGETERDFAELLEFLDEQRFERAGVFEYSREEGTAAFALPAQVHHATRAARRRRAMEKLQTLYADLNRAQIGKTLRVLVERAGVARSEWDAPDIDSTVLVPRSLPAGTFADVTITA